MLLGRNKINKECKDANIYLQIQHIEIKYLFVPVLFHVIGDLDAI